MSVSSSAHVEPGIRQRVLVVDDDLFIRRPLEFLLEQGGFDAVGAANAAECLEKLESHRPDLIILDVVMPGRSGLDVCRAIKQEQRYASLPVILLSSRTQDREQGLDSGAAAYMTKPYSPTDLLRRVRELLSIH